MVNHQKKIYVYENWSATWPNKIGTLYVDVSKGKETFSFEYDSEWLKNSSFAFVLDPDLAMYNGRQFAPLDKAMLGKEDGASAADGTSYLDLASFIKSNGGAPEKDLKELWRRIVFNMAVSNTDDHLRNHGFILTPNGWCLSPLYDVNPVPYGDELSLNVSEEDPSISVELAVETSEYYGFSKSEAEKEAQNILAVVKDNWEKLAVKYGISRSNMEYMRPAFGVCENV